MTTTKPDSLSDGEGGKWTVEDCGYPEYLDGVLSRYTVREVEGRPVAYAFSADDARKLAAAPDLLEALKLAADWMGEWNRPASVMETINAAIAKAEAAS
jgi:hypothetical protein